MAWHHGGRAVEVARSRGLALKDISDFSASLNPFGPPQGAIKAMVEAIELAAYYPEHDQPGLKRLLAAVAGVEPDNILLGNGSASLIYLLFMAFKPIRAIISAPTFCEYERAASGYGSELHFFFGDEEGGFAPDYSRMGHAVKKGDIVFICNPNSPTGALASKDELCHLARICREMGALFVLDEAFVDFADEPSAISLAPEAARSSGIAVVRSLTKFFALPGLRIGYLVGSKSDLEWIAACCEPWPVNSFAIAAASAALTDESYMAQSKAFIAGERRRFFERLQEIRGLKPFAPSANFVLCKITNHSLDAARLHDLLLQERILIRNCENIRGLNSKFFRVAVRKSDENDRLLASLRRCLADGG